MAGRPAGGSLVVVAVGEHHHPDELVVVDLAVAVEVGLPDHLLHLLVRQLLAEVDHHVPQLQARQGGPARQKMKGETRWNIERSNP